LGELEEIGTYNQPLGDFSGFHGGLIIYIYIMGFEYMEICRGYVGNMLGIYPKSYLV
jgi:hypothetical protein